MNILLLPLRGNIIGDSVREISLAKRLIGENPGKKIIYPCGYLIYDLFKNNKYLSPVYIKELDNLNKDISKIKKIVYVCISAVNIVFKIKGINTVIYSGSDRSIRLTIAYLISIIKVSKFKIIGFEYGKKYINELNFTNTEIQNIEKKINTNSKKNISISIEGSSLDKVWSKKNYINLIKNIKNTFNIYLIGSNKEYNKEIINIFGDEINNYVGTLNIRETSLIIKNSDIFIGNDSGLSHIASAVYVKKIIVIDVRNIKINLYNNKFRSKCISVTNPNTIDIINLL